MMSTFTGTREQARPRMMGRHPGQVSYPSKEYIMCVNEGVKASAVGSLSGSPTPNWSMKCSLSSLARRISASGERPLDSPFRMFAGAIVMIVIRRPA